MGQILKKNAQYIFYLHIFIYLIDREKGEYYLHIFIYLIDREKGGGGECIYFWSFTHIIEFLVNIWWQLILIRSQIIIWSYLCDQNWWNIIKKKIDTSFHQGSLISVFQIWFNVYLLTSYMTRFGLWIFMSKSTHDFWLCHPRLLVGFVLLDP